MIMAAHGMGGGDACTWVYILSDLILINEGLMFMQMEKQMAKLRKQRDLAESRLEDFMRIIEHHHQALKVSLGSSPHIKLH